MLNLRAALHSMQQFEAICSHQPHAQLQQPERMATPHTTDLVYACADWLHMSTCAGGMNGNMHQRMVEQGFNTSAHPQVQLLSSFRHPNIVQYVGTVREDGYLYIFLELIRVCGERATATCSKDRAVQ